MFNANSICWKLVSDFLLARRAVFGGKCVGRFIFPDISIFIHAAAYAVLARPGIIGPIFIPAAWIFSELALLSPAGKPAAFICARLEV